MSASVVAGERRGPRGIGSPGRLVLLVVAVVGLVGAGIAVGFPHRSDYLGHFLAGAGGTTLLLACLLGRTQRPLLVTAGVVVAILLGVGTEATVFRIAIFDPVDLATQSLGAVLVGCCLLTARASGRLLALLGATGLLLLTVGWISAFA